MGLKYYVKIYFFFLLRLNDISQIYILSYDLRLNFMKPIKLYETVPEGKV